MNIRFHDNRRACKISLDKLLELKNSLILDNYQPDLCNALRDESDWRLRERVLEYVTDIRFPTDDLLESLCSIMTNKSVSINARILAADALRVLAPRKIRRTMVYPTFRGASVLRIMKDILTAPEVPALHEAVTRALEAIRQES